MRSRGLIAGTTGGAIVLTAALLASGGSAQAPTGRTLAFTEVNRGSTFGFVDNPPRSPRRNGFPTRASAGDTFAITQPLAQAGQSAGRLRAVCTATGRTVRFDRAAFLCHVVTNLRDGTISAEGTVRFADGVITAAVTGGTGAYNGARGTFSSRDAQPTVDTFQLLP